MYKKKFGKLVIISLMAAALTVTPVFAAPTVNELQQKKAEEQNKVSSLQAELTELLTKNCSRRKKNQQSSMKI